MLITRKLIDTSTGPPAPASPPGLPGSNSCDYTIGQSASNNLLERARSAAGARTARFLRPNDVITTEYLASRLNLLLDAKDVVRSLYCG